MKKQRPSQHGGKSPTSVAKPAISQNADDNGDFGPIRWIPSALAASESTLRHLVVASVAEQTDVIDGSSGSGWVIEWQRLSLPVSQLGAVAVAGFSERGYNKRQTELSAIEWEKPVYHEKTDKATEGQIMWIMAAITSETPEWSAEFTVSSKPTNEPKNLVQKDEERTTVYLLLVTRSCRKWNNGAATGVIFDGHNPPHPYLKQVFKVEVDNSGALTLTKVEVSAWSHDSEGIVQGDGGAIASQLVAFHSQTAEAQKGRFELTYQGSGGWTHIDIIVNDNANYYKDSAPADLLQHYKTSTSNDPINDSQRNKDKSPVKIKFELRSKRR